MNISALCRSRVALLLLSLASAFGAEAPLGKPADNHIFAQALVNELARANPDVILIGLHAIPPSGGDEVMIACTHDLIGEKDDEGDLTVVALQQTVLAPNLKDPRKYRVYLPLKDSAGQSIGLMTLNFVYDSRNDETHYCSRAVALRNSVAKRIPNLAALFEPAH